MVREIKENELFDLLELYLNLHESSVPKMTEHLKSVWIRLSTITTTILS